MNDHVVVFTESGRPEGMLAELRSHQRPPLDWTDDGVTCAPDVPCQALSVAGGTKCPKDAIVFLDARAQYARLDSSIDVFLCGGHFAVHRRGKTTLRVFVEPGKVR